MEMEVKVVVEMIFQFRSLAYIEIRLQKEDSRMEKSKS